MPVLEILVLRNDGPRNFAGFDGPAIQRRDNSHHVGLHSVQGELLRAHPVVGGVARGDDGEQRLIDAVSARCEYPHLPAFLAAIHQELTPILEVVARGHFAENPLRWNGRAVGGHHQRNLALRHHGHRQLDDFILPAEEPEMQARRQCVRLVTSLARQGNQPSLRQRLRAEFLHDDSDLALADEHRAQHHRSQRQQEKQQCPRPHCLRHGYSTQCDSIHTRPRYGGTRQRFRVGARRAFF